MGRTLFAVAAASIVILAPGPARADDYFVTVFTAQVTPFRSTHTHTFVAAHRVPAGGGPADECHISWFPKNRKLRGLTLLPEPGDNLSIAETLADCYKHGMRVSAWGPYRVDGELFDRLRAQQAKLESGRVLYKPTDNLYPSDVAANCYHAIWQPFAPLRKYSGPFNCGDTSGPNTLRVFGPWLIDPHRTHDELLPLSVPAGWPVVRRSVEERPGRIDAIRSAFGK